VHKHANPRPSSTFATARILSLETSEASAAMKSPKWDEFGRTRIASPSKFSHGQKNRDLAGAFSLMRLTTVVTVLCIFSIPVHSLISLLGGVSKLRHVKKMVGTTGFEPATSRTPSVRATRLRYVPTGKLTATGQGNQKAESGRNQHLQGITGVRAASRKHGACRADRAASCGSEAGRLLRRHDWRCGSLFRRRPRARGDTGVRRRW
jgi:hypothetical protein